MLNVVHVVVEPSRWPTTPRWKPPQPVKVADPTTRCVPSVQSSPIQSPMLFGSPFPGVHVDSHENDVSLNRSTPSSVAKRISPSYSIISRIGNSRLSHVPSLVPLGLYASSAISPQEIHVLPLEDSNAVTRSTWPDGRTDVPQVLVDRLYCAIPPLPSCCHHWPETTLASNISPMMFIPAMSPPFSPTRWPASSGVIEVKFATSMPYMLSLEVPWW